MPDIQRDIMINLVRGIEDEAHSRGYNTILCNMDNRWDKAEGYANQLLERPQKPKTNIKK